MRTWMWAVAGFALGLGVFALLPRAWLFVEAAPSGVQAAKEVWACPMMCVKLDGPGTCPVCGMDLERLHDTGDVVELDARERRMIDLQTAVVERRVLTHAVRAAGEVALDQRRVARISAWVPGRITRLFADTQWTEVREGEHLFELYSPELLAAQAEHLAAVRSVGLGRDVARSTRDKLLLYGLLPAQVDALEQAGRASDRVVIHAPQGGTIVELMPRQGDVVMEGAPLYTIADYDRLWLLFEATERDLPWIAPGQEVDVTLAAWPGRGFAGAVEFIHAAVDPVTRTTKVRVVLDNRERLLKPGMWGDVTVRATLGADGGAVKPPRERFTCPMHPEVRSALAGACPACGMPLEERPVDGQAAPALVAVPATAVLRTGERSLVYVMTREPRMQREGGSLAEVEPAAFEGREVRVGPRAGEWVPVLAGLAEGERVVTRGAFLIDSQLELLGKVSLLHPEGGVTSTGAHEGH